MSETAPQPPIQATVIGGYLGAGKTTLVNHILRSSGQRIAVLVNDFGDINIDADLIESTDGDTINLANGCICCSLVDGFAAALDQLLTSAVRPERLIIEASGVGDPRQIGAYGQVPGLVLDAVITVADAEIVIAKSRDKYVGTTVVRQLEGSDLIVLNKTDLLTAQQLAVVDAWLAEHFATVPVVHTSHGELNLALLFGQATRTDATPTQGAAASEVFATWSTSGPAVVDRSSFETTLAGRPESILRLKGFVQFTDDERVYLVNCVGPRTNIQPMNASVASPAGLVAIGLTDTDFASWLDEHLEDIQP
jgi:G3E family GTPase